MSLLYLACLLVSLAGMALLDWRHRLFWFADWKRAALVHGAGLAMFLIWDAAGIAAGVFHRGDSPYMTGINLAPELPIEEIFFLFFLCWLTMVVFTGAMRILTRMRDADDTGAAAPAGPADTAGHKPGTHEPGGGPR